DRKTQTTPVQLSKNSKLRTKNLQNQILQQAARAHGRSRRGGARRDIFAELAFWAERRMESPAASGAANNHRQTAQVFCD
ncbi:MAG: hypothetical protein WA673_03765, partial [Candidatus Acidiferrales bacterium]